MNMGKKTAVITVILALLLTGGGTVGYILLFEQQDKQLESSKSEVDLSLESALPKNQQSNLGIQSSNDDSTSQPKIPEPVEFSVYEQYSDAESTQFIDIKVGSGDEATRGTKAHVVYTGYLTSGQIFDQSQINEKGQLVAFDFTLGAGQVISGWEQGIFGMKEGGKRRLIIPSQFGYGEQGKDPIPPNSMLIFDVELVQVDPAQVVPGN